MPSLENQKTKKSTANTREPSIPRIVLDTSDGGYEYSKAVQEAKDNKPSKVINLSTPETDPVKLKAMKAERAKRGDKRDIADLSELQAQEKAQAIELEATNPMDELLEPGGAFDKYREAKKIERAEMLKERQEKYELEHASDEDQEYEVKPKDPDEDVEENEILRDSMRVHRAGGSVKLNTVSMDDTRKAAPVDESAVEEEEKVEADYSSDILDSYMEESGGVELYPNGRPAIRQEVAPEPMTPVEEEPEPEEEEDYFGDTEDDEEPEDLQEEEEPEEEEDHAVVDEVHDTTEPDTTTEEPQNVKRNKVAFTFDESELDDLEEDSNGNDKDSEVPTEDERMDELKAEISRKIRPKARSLKLQGFTIAEKATASNAIFETKETSAGKWVLPTTGITVQMREISGQKIEYLRENMSNNNPTQIRNALKVIYDHIITPKPQSFEAWTKSIAYADYDHLFMPIYLAAFADANYMPQTCQIERNKIPKKETGCGKMFLSENIPVMDLVKFKDDESKAKFWALYNSDRTNPKGLYASEVIPISDKFAIQFCEPTLYSVLFEMGTFNREFQQKYDTVIAFMPYIANIYWIDQRNKKLVRVDYKKYDNNISKTNKSKVIKYSNVFDSFATDEYTNVVSIISSINEKNDWMTYRIPEMTCPECGRTIPEEELSASGLVFTRHRLGILASSSIR